MSKHPFDEVVQVWNQAGALLATSGQMVYYKNNKG